MRLLQRLLAGLLIATALPAAIWAAEITGSIETGAAGVDIKDSPLRVNEYSTIRPDDGVGAYGKLDIGGHADGLAIDAKADVFGSRDQTYELGVDVNRIFRLKSDYQKFQHWLSHDQLNYLDAAVPPGSSWTDGEALSPNDVPAYWSNTANTGSSSKADASYQQIGRASVYGEDLTPDADFNIRYSEWQNQADITLPQLPNLTFHAGYRLQKREGIEQSIGMSKCTACHVTGQGREVNEETKDQSVGVTGRFGQLTVDYTFLDRQFREQAASPMRWYDPALSPGANYTQTFGTFDGRMLYDYEDGMLAYDTTPDSDKQSHVLKARYDFSRDTSLVGSWVNATVESDKQSEAGVFLLKDDTLETEYDSYAFKFATRLLPQLKLTMRGKLEEIDADKVAMTFFPLLPVGGTLPANLGGGTLLSTIDAGYDPLASRDIITLGADAIYRLTPKSSLKLGYEYQEIDRDDDHYDTTTSHTVEATYRAKYSKALSTRVSYRYEKIKDPLQHTDAAGYIDPATGLPYTTNSTLPAAAPAIGTGDLYGTAFYDLRQTDLSNLPEDVHEGKASVTWSPQPNFSATASYRIKMEENALDRSAWEQTTHSPSLSLWYAPTGSLNFTFAYNYFAQATEAKYCQGWYDG